MLHPVQCSNGALNKATLHDIKSWQCLNKCHLDAWKTEKISARCYPKPLSQVCYFVAFTSLSFVSSLQWSNRCVLLCAGPAPPSFVRFHCTKLRNLWLGFQLICWKSELPQQIWRILQLSLGSDLGAILFAQNSVFRGVAWRVPETRQKEWFFGNGARMTSEQLQSRDHANGGKTCCFVSCKLCCFSGNKGSFLWQQRWRRDKLEW